MKNGVICALLLVCLAGPMNARPAAKPSPAKAETTSAADKGIRFDDPSKNGTDGVAARLIELHLQARGGSRKLSSVKTLILHGSLTEGNRTSSITEYYQAPNKYRRDVYRQHLGWEYLTIEATDGQTTWSQEVLPMPKPAVVVDKKARENFVPGLQPYLLLQDWQRAGMRYRYSGEVTAAGASTYLVKGQQADGQTLYYYFDKQHFLPRDVGYTEDVGGRTKEVDRFPLQWRSIDGLRFETAYEVRTEGKLLRQVEYDDVQVNPVVDAAMFAMPGKGKLALISQEAADEPTAIDQPAADAPAEVNAAPAQ